MVYLHSPCRSVVSILHVLCTHHFFFLRGKRVSDGNEKVGTKAERESDRRARTKKRKKNLLLDDSKKLLFTQSSLFTPPVFQNAVPSSRFSPEERYLQPSHSAEFKKGLIGNPFKLVFP